MSWVVLSVLSSLFLGLYEASKKAAVRDNAVPAVLFCSVVIGCCLWLPFLIWSHCLPDSLLAFLKVTTRLGATSHLLLFLKSALVGCSWSLAYYGLKELPISIAGPLRSLGPAWTIFFATTFMQERPTATQWLGIVLVLASVYAFSQVGKLEGIFFLKSRGVLLMVLATILGACSGLYDKFLLQNCGFDAPTVQAWFSVYLVVVLLPLAAFWFLRDRKRRPFHWHWSIPCIAIMLLITDFLYFTAVSQPEALISVISPVRRASVIVSFLIGVFLFGEQHFRQKALCLAILLAGIFLLSWV